ncbi:class I SAM-dependent methyltransferase [Candidatus Pelagibacter ubique]|nr:class I SAM-dependent methyltransferase [Candidatus Pelagibacter ubique]
MSKSIKINTCPVCKSRSKNIHKQFSYEKTINKKVLLKINRCLSINCNHIFLGEYSKSDLNKHYRYPRLVTKVNRSEIKYYDGRINFIKKNINFEQSKSLLEIGPGDGFFLKRINIERKHFFDRNPNIIKKLKKIYKFFNFKNSKQKFDLICASHVLEHTYNPKMFLKELKNKLKLNGSIFIEVPDFSYFSEPENLEGCLYEHTHYFSLKSINKLLESLNLEIVALRRFLNRDNKASHNYVMQYLLNYKGKKKYRINKIFKIKNHKEISEFKKFLNKRKKILIWGLGTNFFKFSQSINLKNYNNIDYVDIREYGKEIFGLKIQRPSNYYKNRYDLMVIATADIENVKASLKKNKISFKKLLTING